MEKLPRSGNTTTVKHEVCSVFTKSEALRGSSRWAGPSRPIFVCAVCTCQMSSLGISSSAWCTN